MNSNLAITPYRPTFGARTFISDKANILSQDVHNSFIDAGETIGNNDSYIKVNIRPLERSNVVSNVEHEFFMRKSRFNWKNIQKSMLVENARMETYIKLLLDTAKEAFFRL